MLKVDDHGALGTPQFVRSTARFLTRASNLAPKDVVLAFANDYRDLLEVNGDTLATYPLTRECDTGGGLMHHFTWQQRIDGIELFGCELRANVTGRGELMNVASTVIPSPIGGWIIPAVHLDETAAIRSAAASVGIVVTKDPLPNGKIGVDGRIWEGSPDFGNQDAIETRKVLFARSRDNVVPAWWVSIPERGVGNTYDTVVDAVDGTVLWRNNRLVWETTQPATYNIYTGDNPAPGSPGTNTPSGFQFPTVPRTLLTVLPADIAPFSPNGWIPDGQTATVGNNIDAYSDANNDNTASAADRATGVGRVFDFPMALTDAPAVYRNASITQLFYYANRFHDRLYELGFTDAFGNFQTTNFAGGTGNDAVKVESQDGGGTNNANFSTNGSDGSNARCQMYLFTGPTPDRDGSFDGDIVYHEMAHGLSIRLHGGGLTGQQAGGMGEGWSDFFGIALNAQSGDDFAAVYAAGAYATLNITAGFTSNYYFGIRRYPYSSDFSKSPLTFADIDNNQFAVDGSVPRGPIGSATANQVHNAGEVWCNVLLEARREIGLSEGFAANQIIMQLVVDGMKNAPAAPDFLDERDAIIQADNVRYAGAHQAALWRAFAKRGMGASASSPAGGATAGIIEAFDVPQRVDFTYPDGLPTIFSPTAPTTFRVTLTPIAVTITPGSATILFSSNSGPYQSAPLQLVSGNMYTATVPALPCFANVNFYLSVGTNFGPRTDPANGAAAPYTRQVLSGVTTIFTDDMEANLGWTGGQPGDTATTGQWQRADPEATTAQPGDDHTPAPGVNCWVTGPLAGTAAGTNDVDLGFTTLLSPLFNVAAYPEATVSYWRWYSNSGGAAANTDTFRVQISNNNGGAWSTFETVGPAGAGTGGGWINFSRRVADVLPPTSQMRLRFIAEDAGAGSLIEAAVDDFLVSAIFCNPPPACYADFNGDGGIDGDDIAAFFQAWENAVSSADVNNDGGIDGEDVSTFFVAWEAGGCG